MQQGPLFLPDRRYPRLLERACEYPDRQPTRHSRLRGNPLSRLWSAVVALDGAARSKLTNEYLVAQLQTESTEVVPKN